MNVKTTKNTKDYKQLLAARSLYMIYKGRAELASVVALKSVSLDINYGDFIAIVGPSGSGKSTFLKILGGLMRPTAGSLYFEGTDITKTSEEELTTLRREKIGYVFQEGNLLPDLSAFDNVNQSMALNGISYTYRKKRTLELLDLMGVLHRKNQLANRLSGGEKQRVAIARAMANNPRLIIADEPTGNVDFKTSVRLLELFKQLNRDVGMAFLIATHSSHVAGYADRSVELRDGLMLGEHARGIDLSELDASRMVIMDADKRITLPANVLEQLEGVGTLWNIDVTENNQIFLTPLDLSEHPSIAKKQVRDCPVCGVENPISNKICRSCGASF
jgi:putative ABC transport system ATP-binding protein